MPRLATLFRRNDTKWPRDAYAALVAEARQPDWYLGGKVPDTMDGRFGLLSTLVALAILRLEDGGEEAVHASVHLTELFIEDMDAQMRQAGFGDPSLGKQVRSLVGALAARVERWRPAIAGGEGWIEAVRWSVYRDAEAEESALTMSSEKLRRFQERLAGADDSEIIRGRWP
ncbi:ubiquinol-cytochrome C chaperone family protein [Sphingomicrobium nitratireducens]|uniref:ubiquinol-cytochrome C chaperone family protein n=1 Tax=Sphingomicrobium nitratireducens TaxID=2964666 RepID=UPI00223F3188|nr:ubiquinol-cytochrome C chaperone family protein [Sphingomicrobium nitratireducens]